MAKQTNKEEGAVEEDHDPAKDENEVKVEGAEENERDDRNEGVKTVGPPMTT